VRAGEKKSVRDQRSAVSPGDRSLTAEDYFR
jgi:hypothetical protein